MKTIRMLGLAAASMLCAGVPARASAAESYAVVSLVGDAMTIVRYQVATGSNLDQNTSQRVALGDGLLDRMATRVAVNTIHRTLPDAAVQGIDATDRPPFGDTSDPVGTDAQRASLVSAVKPLLKQPETHYLVVISKFRGDAHLRVSNGTLGAGKLAGLGFYIDATKRMRKSATGEIGRGFVAPFAYVQVTLVDLQTGAVVRSQSDEETVTRANAGPDADLDPWNVLTADQKVRLLQNELGRAVQKTVPRVVAPT